MRSLSEIVQKEQTALFEAYGVFFAFSNEQFNAQKKEGVTYARLPSGGLVPKEKAQEFIKEHRDLINKGIEQDLKENGKKNIILRELNNYECFYTGDYEDCIDALSGYNISDYEIARVFNGMSI